MADPLASAGAHTTTPSPFAPDDSTLADANAALLKVAALVELLDGCDLDYPLSAGLFVSLLESVQERLDIVVGDLHALARVPRPAMPCGARPG